MICTGNIASGPAKVNRKQCLLFIAASCVNDPIRRHRSCHNISRQSSNLPEDFPVFQTVATHPLGPTDDHLWDSVVFHDDWGCP